MIFRTITKDSTGAINQIGILGKSIHDIKRDLSSGQGKLFSVFGGNLVTSKDLSAIQQYTNLVKSGVPIGKAWSQTMTGCSVAAKQQVLQCKNNISVLEELIAVQKTSTLASKAAKIGMQTLSTALNMVAYALIAKGIELVVSKISDLKNGSKEITENAKSYSSELTDMQSEQSKNFSTISSLSEEYEKLSQGVNILGENISLTSNEYDRYHEICNQIADIMPNLVSGYDEQGNAIINLKNNLSDLNKEYENKMLLEAEQAYNKKDEDGNYKRDSIIEDFDNFKELDTYVKLRDTGTTADDYYDKLKVIATKSKEELSKIYSGDFTEENGVDYSTMTRNREIDSDLIEKHQKQKLKEATRNNWTYFIEYMS